MKKIIYVVISLGFTILCVDGYSQEVKTEIKKKKSKARSTQRAVPLKNNELKAGTTTSNSVKEIKNTDTKEVKPTSVSRPKESVKAVESTNAEASSHGNSGSMTSADEILDKIEPVVTPLPNGNINWTQQYIEAKGVSVLDNERFKNPAQARAMATRGAVVVAQRNLLEIIKGVNVTSETTVQDMMTTNDFIYTRVDGVVKGAQQVGEAIEKNGTIEVSMRVPLYDKNGLAPAIADKVPAPKRLKENPESKPAEIKPEEGAAESLEQVIFNLAGKKFDPSMFPVIFDKDNNIVFDYSKYYDPKTGEKNS
jgi:hypothetical protein